MIRTSASAGANPATLAGMNVTWIEEFKELNEATNSQVNLGTGVLNLTCP